MLGLRSRARADGTAVRGSVAGVATAGGAVVAHAVGGGEVAPLAALAALLVAVPLSARLLRPGRTDAARLLAASLGVQGLWHAFLLLTASTGSSHAGHEMGGMNHDPAAAGHASLDMLLLHLTAGLLAAGLAVGADRAVLGLLRELAGRILPGLPGLVPVPVVSTVGVVPHLVAPRSTVSRSVTARGPPTSGAPSPLLA